MKSGEGLRGNIDNVNVIPTDLSKSQKRCNSCVDVGKLGLLVLSIVAPMCTNQKTTLSFPNMQHLWVKYQRLVEYSTAFYCVQLDMCQTILHGCTQ